MKKCFAACVFSMFFFRIITAQSYPAEQADYENDLFRISFPMDWNVRIDREKPLYMHIIASPDDSTDVFTENLYIRMKKVHPRKFSLDKAVWKRERQIGRLPRVEWFESSMEYGPQYNFHRLVYGYEKKGKKFLVVEDIYKVKDKWYDLVFTMEAQRQEKYLPIARRILETFYLNE